MQNDAFEWHFYKLYVGSHYDALDFLITDGLAETLRTFNQCTWFFLRYFDEGGVHLRVRFRLPRATAARDENDLYGRLHDALTLLPQRLPATYSPLLSFKGAQQPDPVKQPIHCERSAYAPETDIYGGPIGVEIAEELFHASSLVARAVLLQEAAGGAGRKDLALPLFVETLNTYIPRAAIGAFLTRYATFWLSGNPEIGAFKNAFADKAYEMIDDGIAIISDASDYADDVRIHVETWRAAVRRSHERYMRQCPLYSAALADTLGFYFIHLMNNRLGFNTTEESYLAVLLGKSYEHGYQHASA